jgi:hypothetical protein
MPQVDSRPAAVDAKSWDRFFELARIEKDLRANYTSFVGSWPSEVDPDIFSVMNCERLASTLLAYISGPYPGTKINIRPEYQIVNGNIARSSNSYMDMSLSTVVPANEISGTRPEVLVWKQIEKYARCPLARLLFTFPQIYMLSKAARGEKVLWVVNDQDTKLIEKCSTDQVLKIQLYKGTENLLFDVYEALPEGGYIEDSAVAKTLRSLIRLPTDLRSSQERAAASTTPPSRDAEQIKRKLESHPNYEMFKGILNNPFGTGLSGDDAMNIIAESLARREQPTAKAPRAVRRLSEVPSTMTVSELGQAIRELMSTGFDSARVVPSLKVECPNCGPYTEGAKTLLVISTQGGFRTGKPHVFGDPNIAAAATAFAEGRCPSCGALSRLLKKSLRAGREVVRREIFGR